MRTGNTATVDGVITFKACHVALGLDVNAERCTVDFNVLVQHLGAQIRQRHETAEARLAYFIQLSAPELKN